jgi:hypothetical protein
MAVFHRLVVDLFGRLQGITLTNCDARGDFLKQPPGKTLEI